MMRARPKAPVRWIVLVKHTRPGVTEWHRDGGFYDARPSATAAAKALRAYYGPERVKVERVTV